MIEKKLVAVYVLGGPKRSSRVVFQEKDPRLASDFLRRTLSKPARPRVIRLEFEGVERGVGRMLWKPVIYLGVCFDWSVEPQPSFMLMGPYGYQASLSEIKPYIGGEPVEPRLLSKEAPNYYFWNWLRDPNSCSGVRWVELIFRNEKKVPYELTVRFHMAQDGTLLLITSGSTDESAVLRADSVRQ